MINHLILFSSSLQTLYCMYVYILYLFEKIFFILIAAELFTNSIFHIIDSLFGYFGDVLLMRLIHLLLISSLVWLLYCMYVYILYLFRKILRYPFRPSIY